MEAASLHLWRLFEKQGELQHSNAEVHIHGW